jgi:uncharacterized MAPEG superfamily protein
LSIPFVCVLILLLLVYLSRVPVGIAMSKVEGGYNNANPRDQQAQLTGWGRRALGAHQNTLESFAPFAAGVVICYLAKGSLLGSTVLSLSFIAARIAYPLLYIADLATARSVAWGIGVLSTLGLYILPWLS